MAMHQRKDPQNPYRTGVLCGNYVEDRFGAELAAKEVSTNLIKRLNSSLLSNNLFPIFWIAKIRL